MKVTAYAIQKGKKFLGQPTAWDYVPLYQAHFFKSKKTAENNVKYALDNSYHYTTRMQNALRKEKVVEVEIIVKEE